MTIHFESKTLYQFYHIIILAAEHFDLKIGIRYHHMYKYMETLFKPPETYWMFYLKHMVKIYKQRIEKLEGYNSIFKVSALKLFLKTFIKN